MTRAARKRAEAVESRAGLIEFIMTAIDLADAATRVARTFERLESADPEPASPFKRPAINTPTEKHGCRR